MIKKILLKTHSKYIIYGKETTTWKNILFY